MKLSAESILIPCILIFQSSNMSLAAAASSSNSNTASMNNSPTETVGGGAINEKQRQYDKHMAEEEPESTTSIKGSSKSNFDPRNQPAHLLHAMVGLERYPNYLSRWNYDFNDVDRLESALEEQLDKVRKQKQQILQRNAMIDTIREKVVARTARSTRKVEHANANAIDGDDTSDDFDIFKVPQTWEEIRKHVLDPKASRTIFGSKQFRKRSSSSSTSTSSSPSCPTIKDVLSGRVKVELDLALLEDWLDEEFFDVYSFPILSESFCMKLKDALKHIIDQSKMDETHLEDFGKRPIDLDSAGFSWVNNLLFHLVMRPLSRQLFGTTEGFDDLDWRQGYIAGYSSQPSENKGAQRHRLVPHTDDSEVTLNVGMGDDFEGGDLSFWNLRGTQEEGNHVGEFHPRIGHAMLHSGRHLHEVKEVTKGDRYAMIIWARSWGSLRNTTCPCCWMTRRQENGGRSQLGKHRCISSRQWN